MIGRFFLCPMGSYQVSGYLGLEFQIKGQTHYGWALVSIAAVFNGRTGSMETKLSGFAYETIPGAAIKTGQTSGADEDSAVGPEPISRDDFSAYSVSGNFFYTRLLIDSNERAVAPEVAALLSIGMHGLIPVVWQSHDGSRMALGLFAPREDQAAFALATFRLLGRFGWAVCKRKTCGNVFFPQRKRHEYCSHNCEMAEVMRRRRARAKRQGEQGPKKKTVATDTRKRRPK